MTNMSLFYTQVPYQTTSRYYVFLNHSSSPPPSLPFPYSAMWLGHECQTTWQNMEMDTEQFRNLQESGTCNRYVSGTKKDYHTFLESLGGCYSFIFIVKIESL